MTYDYRYDATDTPPDERGRYDEPTRDVMRGNVSRSLMLDAERARLAPSASQLRARVVAHLATRNGH